jgi:hypothetical protein
LEKQKRGLAHLHGVVSVESPAHQRWAEAYINALQELAPRYGFGFVDGWHKVGRKFWLGVQAAAYLSSYFTRRPSTLGTDHGEGPRRRFPQARRIREPGPDGNQRLHDAKVFGMPDDSGPLENLSSTHRA